MNKCIFHMFYLFFVQDLELVEDDECLEVFPRFLKFLYGCKITLNSENTLPVLILADKYNVIDLRQVRLYILSKILV